MAERTGDAPRFARAAVLWTAIVATALVAWFFVAWLVLRRHVLDAAGESVGSALVLMVVVSVIGAARAGRRTSAPPDPASDARVPAPRGDGGSDRSGAAVS